MGGGGKGVGEGGHMQGKGPQRCAAVAAVQCSRWSSGGLGVALRGDLLYQLPTCQPSGRQGP